MSEIRPQIIGARKSTPKIRELYRTSCSNPAMKEVAPRTAGKLTSMEPAALLPVGLELLELEALLP